MKSSDLERSISTLASLPSASIAIFQLLVVVSGLLSPEDCEALGPVLWDHFIDETDPNFFSPVGYYLNFIDNSNIFEGGLLDYAMCGEGIVILHYSRGPEGPHRVR